MRSGGCENLLFFFRIFIGRTRGLGHTGLNHMVERKDRNRDPHGRCGAGADLENGETGNAQSEHDLQIDDVSGRKFNAFIEMPEVIDDDAGGVGMLGEIFGFLLDLAGERVDLVGRGRSWPPV